MTISTRRFCGSRTPSPVWTSRPFSPMPITVIGRGEQGLLVKTADGVREPQNRRVEIVIQ